MTDGQVGLAQAIAEAVAEGRAELNRLEDLADTLTETVARNRPSDNDGSEAASKVDQVVRQFRRDLRRYLDDIYDSLATFNIVFFGRTGAGKSTLMSALGQLDGGYVSPGASDWTTDVHHVEWNDCRLYDTPGINGWGRTESRESLEATARAAVETADIVLLCFDSQNQQAMEFAKIASWIRDFGKPAIAVLNVRNGRWRHPALVPEDRRQHLSDSVRQHADNIRTELAQIGLGSTPLVALQSRRALFARASTPFTGPAAESFEHERHQFGTDYLARWSNFETLEKLLLNAISEGASDIRLSAIQEDIRNRYMGASQELTDMANEYLEESRHAEDRTEALLAIIGYPTSDEGRAFLAGTNQSGDLVDSAEKRMGHAFNSPTKGSLDRFVRHQLASHLAKLQRNSRFQAERVIDRAFSNQSTITEHEFVKAVFDETAINSAIKDVWELRGEYLMRELQIASEQGYEHEALLDSASFSGIGGDNMAADVLRGAGIAAGLAALAVPFIWNPVGWVAGAAAAGVGIAGQVQQHFGRKMKTDAKKKAGQARSQAIADATSAVDKTYEAYGKALQEASRAAVWETVAPVLTASLHALISLLDAHHRAGRLAFDLEDQAASIRSARPGGDILVRAQEMMGSSPAETTRILLGEDWIESDDGHRGIGELDEAVRATFADQSATTENSLRAAITNAWRSPTHHDIRRWSDELEDAGLDDPELLKIARHMRTITRNKPSFSVLGDYNSGKTSLIRRILVETDSRTDQGGLQILARPATSSEQRYEFPRLSLIDTPGLQSGDPDHDEAALEAIAESALIFVVLHVNLLIGNTTLIEEVAAGSERVAAKAGRMIYLINRSDELGADPFVEPAAFLNLQARKKAELIAALAAKSIDADASMVHCLAADPFGLVGNADSAAADAFDDNRFWDGTASLISTISGLPDTALAEASAAAGFDSALAMIRRRRADLEAERKHCNAALSRRGSRIITLEAALADAGLLRNSIDEEAENIISTAVQNAVADLYQVPVGDNAELDSVTNHWYGDPRIRAALDRYDRQVESDLLSWQEEHADMIQREFRDADAAAGTPSTGTFNAQNATGTIDGLIGGAGNVAGHAAKVAKALGNRNAVYAIGKRFGHKFKPWGAVKGGARVAKVGVVLGAVAAAADAKSMFDDSKKSKMHKANLSDALATIQDQASQLVVQITEREDGTGPVGFLDAMTAELQSLLEETEADRSILLQERQTIELKIDVADGLLLRAAELADRYTEAEQ